MSLFRDLADALAAGLSDRVDLVDRAYPTDPGMAGFSPPAIVVGFPTLRRTDPEEAESELGRVDYFMDFPVVLYVALNDLQATADRVLEAMEQMIAAVDDFPTWLDDPEVLDARVTSAEPAEIVDAAQPLLSYMCRVELHRLVAAA